MDMNHDMSDFDSEPEPESTPESEAIKKEKIQTMLKSFRPVVRPWTNVVREEIKLPTSYTFTLRRGISVNRRAMAEAADPIQKLYVDKIKEYEKQSSQPDFLKKNPGLEREIESERTRMVGQYGGKSDEDLKTFPSFQFDPPAELKEN